MLLVLASAAAAALVGAVVCALIIATRIGGRAMDKDVRRLGIRLAGTALLSGCAFAVLRVGGG